MIDLALCFASKAAYNALGLVNEPGRFDIDVIGAMWKETGATDAQGLPVYAPISGYHVNIRCRDNRSLTALTPFRVYPATPSRAWA